MSEEKKTFKSEISVRWIKGSSGTTYLCPAAILDRIPNPSESDLKRVCVDESQNPQND